MSFIKNYNFSLKEDKKSVPLLKEASGGGGIAGFVGKRGQGIDDIFAGGFFPNDNLVMDLDQQLIDLFTHREFTDKHTPKQETKWEELETNLEYDDVVQDLDGDRYINTTDKMKKIDSLYNYDIEEKKDISIYKNETQQWKPIISLKDLYTEI